MDSHLSFELKTWSLDQTDYKKINPTNVTGEFISDQMGFEFELNKTLYDKEILDINFMAVNSIAGGIYSN